MKFQVKFNEETLLKAGYKRQSNGFTRKFGSDSRFHAKLKIVNWQKTLLDIHCDIYINKNKLHPSVFHTPNLLKAEIERIKKYA